jgi:methylated-DNA-[protein]-cysteine S-methyltransferase
MQTPIGVLRITQSGDAISRIELGSRDAEGASGSGLLKEACAQLSGYFGGTLRRFELPLRPVGTDFQLRVWRELLTIPYGQTRSYGDVARMAGRPGAARAVGGAVHLNPLLIVVPCHRVIMTGGGLGGFGCGTEIKQRLLALEGAKYRREA